MIDPRQQPLASQPPTILLVDDDFNITAGLKDILEDSGYEVEVAGSGAEALEHRAKKFFHVMVVDYSLPDSNGIQLAQKMRALDPTIEVLLMTGHDLLEIETTNDTKGLYAAFLRKPVDIQMMTREVGQAMSRQFHRLGLNWAPPSRGPVPATVSSPRPAAQPVPAPVLELGNPPHSQIRWGIVIPVVFLILGSFGAGWYMRGGLPEASPVLINPRALLHRPITETAGINSVPQATTEAPPAQLPPPLRVVAAPLEPPSPPANRPETHVSSKSKEAPRKQSKAEPPAAAPVAAPSAPAAPLDSTAKDDASTDEDSLAALETAKSALKISATDLPALAALEDTLHDSDATHRVAAIQVVSELKIKAPDVISILSQMLFDQDPTVSFSAANALAHMGPAALPAVPNLIEAMNYKSEATQSVGNAAKAALMEIGAPAIPDLIKGLENLNVCRDVMDVLGHLGTAAQSAIPALNALKNDADLGAAAVEAIQKIQGDAKPG